MMVAGTNTGCAGEPRPPSWTQRRSRERGMSLIEVMIALAVISIAVFAFMNSLFYAIRMKESHRELVLAQEAATLKLEEIRAQPFDDIFTVYGAAGYSFDVEGLAHPDNSPSLLGYGTVTVDDSQLDLLDVEVKIEWVGVYGATQFTASSLYTE